MEAARDIMKGYAGKVLWVDLTSGRNWTEPLDQEVARRFIGGKGLGAHLLTERLDPEVDPLSPGNLLAFFTGPLTGTRAPTSNRFGAFFKSPQTGIWGESYAGGHLAPHIKKAGYDGIVVTGKAEGPVYLSMVDDRVEIKDASHLWGKDTVETEDTVKGEMGEKAHVMTIGPAGENLVKFACVCNDHYRQLGRAGGGAVMGSKNLKAVGILGTGEVELHDPEGFKQAVKEVREKIPKNGALTTMGTPVMVNVQNALGTFPTHYWQEGFFDLHEKINAAAMKELILDKNKACWNCPVACGKLSSVKQGDYEGTEVEGPEYETLFAFGGLCELADIRDVAKVNEICDRLGMDTITGGNVIGFAMRAYELDRLGSDFPIEFGDTEVTLRLLDMIAHRKGLGDDLAEGVRGAGERLDLEDIAVHVKGLEVPGYDPRGYNGMALSYAVGVRGADHLRSAAYGPEGQGLHDRFMVSGKGVFVKQMEDKLAMVDSMIICNFVRGAYEWEDFASLYRLATGLEMDADSLKEASERIINLARGFSTKLGISRKDDRLPEVFHRLPFPKGSSRTHVVVKEDLETMLDEYYNARNWSEDGVPPMEDR